MSLRKYLSKLDDLQGKKVIVTGGTSGIGLSIVKHLLFFNAHVVILARNENKAMKVKESLLGKYPQGVIDFVKYDQSDDQSVINACEEIINKHADFYALIMNAGIFQSKKKQTRVNDIYCTIKTNYVGLALFIKTILEKIKGEHRYIFQGSFVAGYHLKKIKSLRDKDISAWQQYLISKSGVEALYYHYINNNPTSSFYLVEPGLTNSDIIRDFPAFIRWLGHLFMKTVSHSTDKAALTAIYALQSNVGPCYIVPRGLLTFMGYPKVKVFPKKRRRQYLYDLSKSDK